MEGWEKHAPYTLIVGNPQTIITNTQDEHGDIFLFVCFCVSVATKKGKTTKEVSERFPTKMVNNNT